MKNLLAATLPAMALLALGGCATSGALTSVSESDGVYYSSQDHTTANATLSQVQSNRAVAGSPNPDGYTYNAPANTTVTSTIPPGATDDANPDYYQGSAATNAGITGAASDYYVSNYGSSYSPSGFGVPYTGPGVSTYNYAPAVAVTPAFYGSPWGYGAGLSFGYGYPYGAYSPYAYSPYYDPFYSPFYSPWYGYRSGLSLSFGYGFGSPWGYGFGYPYYGYGYGYGYPYGGYGYGGGYYGYNNYRSLGSARPGIYSNDAGGAVRVGPRGQRGSMMPGSGLAPGSTGPVTIGNGRRGSGYVTNAGGFAPAAPTTPARDEAMPAGGRGWRPGNAALGQPVGGTPGAPEATSAGTGRRGGFFGGFFGNGNAGGGRPAAPDMSRNGGYAPQPGNYSPQQSRRSFDAAPSRSFEAPRYSAPAPSRSFGGGSFGGGGGSFGGGGGGGRRGR